jgi:hypothetical protein
MAESEAERERWKRMALADPVTHAATLAAQAEAEARYGDRLEVIAAEIKTLLAGRAPYDLAGDDAVRFMSLRADFDALAIEQKQFAEAVLTRRLNGDGEGGVG